MRGVRVRDGGAEKNSGGRKRARAGRENACRKSGRKRAARTVRRQEKAGSYHVSKGRRAQACVREEREENGAREKQ